MRFNVAQLLKEHSGASRRYSFTADPEGIDEEIHLRSPLRGDVKLYRTSQGVLVTGELHVTVEVTCDRCLESVLVPLSFTVEEEFYPRIDINTGVRLPIPDDAEPETLIDRQNIIDLTEVVRQDILIAIPMHPLCRPDCAGLCPECGHNLNEGPCGCEVRPLDPRWSALEQWRSLGEN